MGSIQIANNTRLPVLALSGLLVLAACDSPYVGPGGTPDPKVDAPMCTAGVTRCENNSVMVCQADSSGVVGWTEQQACGFGTQTCKQTSSGGAACVNLPTCTDGKKNQNETGVDCGGSTCGACPAGQQCKADADCQSKACIKGKCMPCKGKTASCYGNLVRVCKDDHTSWVTVHTCDVKKNEVCNAATRTCDPAQTNGTAKPTGTYYLFGYFEKGSSDFKGGYDVDGFGDRLYVNNNRKLDVYKVQLEDTDGDKKLEPNQHPENKKNKGPIEKRKLVFEKTYSNVTLGQPSVGEIWATKDRIYFLKRDTGGFTNVYEFIWGTGQTNLVVQGNIYLCCLGYDEQNKQWFGAHNSSKRYVYAYYPKGNGWATEFLYPDLAGSHLDGIEVVQDPKTKTSYVYTSDMTSDFLAQYYRDKTTGKWVQKNVFEYKEDKNNYVEGMGFGAFQHFWMTSGKALYEVGGGDLQEYVGIK